MGSKGTTITFSKKPKYKSRQVRHCLICGRRAGFNRLFNLCRICFRERAMKGELPGFRKSSW